MKKWNISRRSLLQGAAGLAGAAALGPSLISSVANAQTAEKSAVLVVFLRGGYNALFSNADSFVPAGTFGTTAANVMAVGNGLTIDRATYGTLGAAPLANIAAIGINHGISSHDPARVADWTNGSRSYALMLANAMGGTAPIKMAVVGSAFPDGPRPAENGVSMQSVTDVVATLNSIGAGQPDPNIPVRATAAAALGASRTMSQSDLAANAVSLSSAKNAYDTQIAALSQGGGATGLTWAQIAAAYPGANASGAVTNFSTQMAAAEAMVLRGTNVIAAISNAGWDTHGDTSGARVRGMMTNTILPGLRTFSQRMMALAGYNVTVAIYGDFSRSLPGSDHARAVGTTVWGKKVRVGVSGKINAQVGMQAANPAGQAYNVSGFWSFLASTAKSPTNPFGTNPHAGLVLP